MENAGTSGELSLDAAMGTLATACSNVILRDSSLLHAKTCGADFRNGTRALLRAVRIAKTTVPALRDETSLVRCEKEGTLHYSCENKKKEVDTLKTIICNTHRAFLV